MAEKRDLNRRADLEPLERAVSDTLDEWLTRLHGIFTSWASPVEFIDWLEKRGYTINLKVDEIYACYICGESANRPGTAVCDNCGGLPVED